MIPGSSRPSFAHFTMRGIALTPFARPMSVISRRPTFYRPSGGRRRRRRPCRVGAGQARRAAGGVAQWGDMPAAKGKSARTKKPSGTPRRRRGVKLRPTELGPADLALGAVPDDLAPLAAAIDADGGRVLAAYREPLGGHVLLFAALPVARVAPTPFQRDISDAHVRRLTQAMDKTRRFLDPIIAVHEADAAAAVEPEARY